MTIERLTRPTEILTLWDFFVQGLLFLENEARERYDFEQMQKLLCQLAASPSAFVAVAYDDNGQPVSFAAAQENSLPFGQSRTAVVLIAYHRPEFQQATLLLEGAFENWCREVGIKSYSLTSKRKTGAVIRCLRHRKYGFKRPYLVFEKDII